MKGIFIFLIVLIATIYVETNPNVCPGKLESLGWCDCSGTENIVTLHYFDFTPNPIVLGSNVTGKIVLTNTQSYLNGGIIQAEAQLMGVTILDRKYKICDLLRQAHENIPAVPECPIYNISTGYHVVPFQFKIPDVIPTGEWSGYIRGFNSNMKEIHCLKIKMHVH
jgi:hypothetical protein